MLTVSGGSLVAPVIVTVSHIFVVTKVACHTHVCEHLSVPIIRKTIAFIVVLWHTVLLCPFPSSAPETCIMQSREMVFLIHMESFTL